MRRDTSQGTDPRGMPPRVAWFLLPFRGHEEPEAAANNRRAAGSLLRWVGIIPGTGNPYVTFLEGTLAQLGPVARLEMVVSDTLPRAAGEREGAVAGRALELLSRSQAVAQGLRGPLREAAQRYGRGKPGLSDTQHCFFLEVGGHSTAAVAYVTDVAASPRGQLRESYRAAMERSYQQYLREAPLNPNMTFFEYALRQ